MLNYLCIHTYQIAALTVGSRADELGIIVVEKPVLSAVRYFIPNINNVEGGAEHSHQDDHHCSDNYPSSNAQAYILLFSELFRNTAHTLF